MLKDFGLIEGETIAIDSFKIFAQNSIRNNFTPKKIDRHLDYIDRKVAEYEAQLNESDAEEKAMLKEKIELKLYRRKKYEELKKVLKIVEPLKSLLQTRMHEPLCYPITSLV